MLSGKIKAYSTERKYGFITGDDGSSYFFHRNDLKDRQGKPSIGQLVSFSDVPTPKGMAAKQVVIEQDAEKIFRVPSSSDMIVSKTDRCGRDNEVVHRGQAAHVESRSPDEAVRRLKAGAQAAGFNALVDLSRSQRSFSGLFDGNYRYTVHTMTAVPALVRQVEHTADKQKIQTAKAQLANDIKALEGKTIPSENHSSSPGIRMVLSWIVTAIIGLVIFSKL